MKSYRGQRFQNKSYNNHNKIQPWQNFRRSSRNYQYQQNCQNMNTILIITILYPTKHKNMMTVIFMAK